MMVMMMMIFIENKPVMLLHGVANNIVIFFINRPIICCFYIALSLFANFNLLQKHAEDP